MYAATPEQEAAYQEHRRRNDQVLWEFGIVIGLLVLAGVIWTVMTPAARPAAESFATNISANAS